MKIHKEGYVIILVSFILLACLSSVVWYFSQTIAWLWISFSIAAFIFWMLIVQFFRVPKRITPDSKDKVLCPADGEVVVIEETEETEYLKRKCIQISIFMSPLNVHQNKYPFDGTVSYMKYHPGKYLVAWHPKSSTENERTTVVVKDDHGVEILFRQIAGAVARRIVCYAKEGDVAKAGEEFGFIKFGSRVDVFLPLDADIQVKVGDKVRGTETILAQILR